MATGDAEDVADAATAGAAALSIPLGLSCERKDRGAEQETERIGNRETERGRKQKQIERVACPGTHASGMGYLVCLFGRHRGAHHGHCSILVTVIKTRQVVVSLRGFFRHHANAGAQTVVPT